MLQELLPGYPVHWVVDQAEYAVDLLFTSRTALAGLYRALVAYAVQTFTPKDILGFLGRKPKVVDGRSYAGFHPARRDDVRLFRAVLDGDHIMRGVRNADIRGPLFGVRRKASEQRRDSAAVGRLLKRLHVRHLVAKIPRTRRWRVTDRGRHLLGEVIQLYHRSWPELAA